MKLHDSSNYLYQLSKVIWLPEGMHDLFFNSGRRSPTYYSITRELDSNITDLLGDNLSYYKRLDQWKLR